MLQLEASVLFVIVLQSTTVRKRMLASMKEEGIEKAWRLPVVMDLDDLEPRSVYRRPLKCTINKQL